MLSDLHEQLSAAYDGQISQDDLAAEDCDMLQHLSPQGLAKLNSDAIKGIRLESSLSELKIAYEGMIRRREKIRQSLPASASAIIAKSSRPLTSEEMLLFLGLSTEKIQAEINKLVQQGRTTEEAIEELTAQHRDRQQPDPMTYLAPTSLGPLPIPPEPPSTTTTPSQEGTTRSQSPSSPSATGGGRPTPFELWFDEYPTKRFLASSSSISVASNGSPHCSPPRRKGSILITPSPAGSAFGSPVRSRKNSVALPGADSFPPPSTSAGGGGGGGGGEEIPTVGSLRRGSVTISDSVEVLTFHGTAPIAPAAKKDKKRSVFGKIIHKVSKFLT